MPMQVRAALKSAPRPASLRGLPPGCLEWGSVEDEPAVGDLAVVDRYALGAGRALDRKRLGVVHHQGGLLVAKSGDQLRPDEALYERRHKGAIRLRALDAPCRRLADDVLGDVAHGLTEVLAGPGVVVG